MIITNGVGITTLKNGVAVKQALSAANSTVNKGVYNDTLLETVDADLAVGNIKSGVTIFGVAGAATVQEIGAADAAVADVKAPKTFFSVTGGIKTGTLATVALDPAANAYPAGYHVGAASLTAVDADLAAANIKSGVTIFGVLGTFSQTATHDIEGQAAAAGDSIYFYTCSRAVIGTNASSDSDIATLTQAYTAGSLAEGYGHALLSAINPNVLKLRLYMDGVQVGEGGFIQSVVYMALEVVNGNKALSGSKIVKLSVHNYDAVNLQQINISGNTLEHSTYIAGVFAGSVKVV